MKNIRIRRFTLFLFLFAFLFISCQKENVPSVETGSVMHKTDTTITVVGNVLEEGSSAVTVRGICWSTSPGAKAIPGYCTTNGSGLGTFSGRAGKLADYTVYYLRAYAINASGTGYGTEIQVETLQAAKLAVVQTSLPKDVGFTSAILGGVASGYGGDRPVLCGICWSKSPDPTMDSEGNKTGSYTTDAFGFEITNLEYNTTYYARAYVVNTKGPSYGASQVFKTGDFAGLRFVQVQGGTFQMGSLNGNDNEKPIHNVTLPSFKIATTEVSQALWKAITGYSYSSVRGDSMPVNNISYYDVLSFISTLNAITRKQFRLPTEAEWEYAAGGGNTHRYIYAAGVDYVSELAARAWYGFSDFSGFQNVARKLPNSLGIYDMSGSMWELCSDKYELYSAADQTNPKVTSPGKYLVIRGGSFFSTPDSCRTSSRAVLHQDSLGRRVGFRLVQM